MIARIFIGSSTEALSAANALAKWLSDNCNVQAVVWPEIFSPGLLTFEALEKGLPQFSGAILVATPDDPATIKGRPVNLPRANVMVEFAYTAAILTRKRVILARFEDVELPSDFNSITYVPMGPITTDFSEPPDKARQQLAKWIKSLRPSVEGFDCTIVAGGYTGKWQINVIYDKWWGRALDQGDFVKVSGIANLLVSEDGRTGSGILSADIRIRLSGKTARIRTVEHSQSVHVNAHGTLVVRTENFMRIPVVIDPELVGLPGFNAEFPEAPPDTHAELNPRPSAEGVMEGTVRFNIGTPIESTGFMSMRRILVR